MLFYFSPLDKVLATPTAMQAKNATIRHVSCWTQTMRKHCELNPVGWVMRDSYTRTVFVRITQYD